ncbi:MAG: twin-arginine translocation signal domain-containing protein [Halobacteriota archaeon]
MDRRTFLGTAGVSALGALAGCAGLPSMLGETTYGREPPLVSDRPDGIYFPTHTEAMKVAATGTTDTGLRVLLAYTFPHRFWRVFADGEGGYESRIFEVGPEDAVHMMVGVWDADTERPLPVSGVNVAVSGGNDVRERETVYPMLSPRMGFHYGDNYHLDGDGEYTAEITIEGIVGDAYGDFEGRFDRASSVSLAFEYDEAERNALEFEAYPDRQGERDTVKPMSMDYMPLGFASELPGRHVGEGMAADIRYRASVLDADRFGEDPYLAVTASTRYNDLLVPLVGLDAAVQSKGSEFDRSLTPSIDPELGFHYGAQIPAATGELDVAVRVTTPPQIARHEGYETAFFGTPTIELGE